MKTTAYGVYIDDKVYAFRSMKETQKFVNKKTHYFVKNYCFLSQQQVSLLSYAQAVDFESRLKEAHNDRENL